MSNSNLSALKKRLRLISQLAQREPLSFETNDSIGREAHHALRDVDEIDQASVDNILDFRMRESTAEASTTLAHIVDVSNN
jgi:hypothetical protein